MAGTLVLDTIRASSGVFATQNGMTGIAKAWVNYNGITTTTIRSSFNVSSVTFVATGRYTVNFTTAMSDANYFVGGSATSDAGFSGASSTGVLSEYKSAGTTYGTKTTGAIQVCTIDNGGDTFYSSFSTNVAIFGN